MPEKNIVVMGGSFNPPTIAHLKIMQAALDAVQAERGYFVPVSYPYLKRKLMNNPTGRLCLSDDQRMGMLRAMCRVDARLAVSELELHEVQSVTYRTMSGVSTLHPDARCYFVAGADKLELIARWGKTSDFLERFGVVLFYRQGIDPLAVIGETEGLREYRDSFVILPQPAGIDGISSTAVRERFFAGESAQPLLCPGVWQLLKDLKPEDFPEEISRFREEYEFLANGYPAEVSWEGLRYPSAEAAFQASKTHDPQIRRSFTNATAEKARQRGSSLKPEETWEADKLEIMFRILEAKFRDPDLAEKLLATGDAVLIAGGYGKDLFWGMDLYSRVGENHLGKLLMHLRDTLRAKEGK